MFSVPAYDDFRTFLNNRKIVIRGAGLYGMLTYKVVKGFGMEVECFVITI